jgi:hypothetical protein
MFTSDAIKNRNGKGWRISSRNHGAVRVTGEVWALGAVDGSVVQWQRKDLVVISTTRKSFFPTWWHAGYGLFSKIWS